MDSQFAAPVVVMWEVVLRSDSVWVRSGRFRRLDAIAENQSVWRCTASVLTCRCFVHLTVTAWVVGIWTRIRHTRRLYLRHWQETLELLLRMSKKYPPYLTWAYSYPRWDGDVSAVRPNVSKNIVNVSTLDNNAASFVNVRAAPIAQVPLLQSQIPSLIQLDLIFIPVYHYYSNEIIERRITADGGTVVTSRAHS